jgi:hypothetical protein
MMGPKTVSTIRSELKSALANTGKDPVQWLEDRIQQLERGRAPARGEIEVLQALCRVLEGPGKRRRTAQRRSKSSR